MTPAWVAATPAALAFWLAYLAVFLPEIVGSFFQNAGAADRKQDRGSKAVLVAGTMSSVFAAFILAQSAPRLLLSPHTGAMLWLGAALMTSGVALRWYSIRVLGRFFTRDVAIRENHRIVRDGPYRYLRHPSYSGYLLAMFGLGIALNNWPAVVILLVANFAVYGYRMHIEEAALGAAFGDAYSTYRRETNRVIPYIY